MGLNDFNSKTEAQTDSTAKPNTVPNVKGNEGEALESIVQQVFDDLDGDNSKSFHFEDEKVVADRQELVEEVMMMCAMTVQEVCN